MSAPETPSVIGNGGLSDATPAQPGKATCAARKLRGGECRANPTSRPASDGRYYCAHHHPDIDASVKSAWGRRGSLVQAGRLRTAQLREAAASAGIEIAEERRVVDGEALDMPDERTALALRDRPSLGTPQGIQSFIEDISGRALRNEIAPSQLQALVGAALAAARVVEAATERMLVEAEIAAHEGSTAPQQHEDEDDDR